MLPKVLRDLQTFYSNCKDINFGKKKGGREEGREGGREGGRKGGREGIIKDYFAFSHNLFHL